MRFKITGEQRKVFEKQKYIEFENLFSLEQIEEISKQIDTLLSKRLHKLIENESPQELYKIGRDLWRDSSDIKNFVTHSTLAQIAGQLFHQDLMALAYDQILQTTIQTGLPSLTPSTLQQKSCIQPLAGGVLIRLQGDSKASHLLPQNPLNAVFIAPDLLIPWEMFFQEPSQSVLLITYAPLKARYVFEKTDIHTHALKKLGYAFGDNLNSTNHPVIYRG